MKQKVLGLAVVAIMLTLVLVQFEREREAERTLDGSVLLLPELKTALSSVSEIEILNGEKEARVTILKQGESWVIREKSGYLANFEILSKLLIEVANLEVAEQKTSKAENHSKLGLADIGESMGVIVRISADRVYEMMIGQTSQTLGTFVRKPEEDQVYLVEQSIEVSMDPIDYLDSVFLSVESSDVQTVTIQSPDSSLKAVRDEATKKLVIEDIPEGAELRYDTVVDSLARIFINLRFDDVQPYRSETFSQPTVTTVTTSSGESIIIRSQNIEETFWVHLEEDWQYKVSEFTYNELNKSMQDMLKTEAENE